MKTCVIFEYTPAITSVYAFPSFETPKVNVVFEQNNFTAPYEAHEMRPTPVRNLTNSKHPVISGCNDLSIASKKYV